MIKCIYKIFIFILFRFHEEPIPVATNVANNLRVDRSWALVENLLLLLYQEHILCVCTDICEN